MSITKETISKLTEPGSIEKEAQLGEAFDSSILSKLDIESINKNNKSISTLSFNLDFIYIKRRKYAMYNTEVKRKCIELVRLNLFYFSNQLGQNIGSKGGFEKFRSAFEES
jgi:hypothetical protein